MSDRVVPQLLSEHGILFVALPHRSIRLPRAAGGDAVQGQVGGDVGPGAAVPDVPDRLRAHLPPSPPPHELQPHACAWREALGCAGTSESLCVHPSINRAVPPHWHRPGLCAELEVSPIHTTAPRSKRRRPSLHRSSAATHPVLPGEHPRRRPAACLSSGGVDGDGLWGGELRSPARGASVPAAAAARAADTATAIPPGHRRRPVRSLREGVCS